MNHREKELDAMPKHRPSKATVEEWNRQLELLLDDARKQGDSARIERLRLIEKTINVNEAG